MAAASLAADLDAVGRQVRAQRLEPGRGRVQLRQGREVALGVACRDKVVVDLLHVAAGEQQRVRRGQEREEQPLLRLEVEHLRLVRANLLALAAHGRVARGDRDGLAQVQAGVNDDVRADEDHSRIAGLGHGRARVFAVWGDAGEAHEHDVARRAVVGQTEIAVIDGDIAQLRADVAQLDARQRQVRLEVAQLDHERVRAEVLALEHEARHEDAVRRRLAEAARPPLDARVGRRVEHKLLAGLVVDGEGLEAANVCAVAELGLGVRADDLVVVDLGQPVGLLLVRGLPLDRVDEHGHVQVGRQRRVD
eukprot:Unigene3537_Nuclearia_a/m.10800 Unigene3537_Nuclearia_a/g.10800  ORF Unigene3537_Nuclearia_a/g.10800 Unigene3537_Nuclearia_a/m.10800 type:complete len:307 (-) Unigene3537_Nuclearia_a:340-1260(-)